MTCATVSGSALLQCSPDKNAERDRAPLNTRVAQAIAVHDVLHNERWELEDQREWMCAALIASTEIALESGAIAPDDVKLTYWLPRTGGIVPDLARKALEAEAPSVELERVADVAKNKRWAEVAQRGALCNALVVAERAYLESEMLQSSPGES
jgi:hypothetical protein